MCLMVASDSGQTAREVRGAAAVEPLQHEPPAKIGIRSLYDNQRFKFADELGHSIAAQDPSRCDVDLPFKVADVNADAAGKE